MDTSTVFRLIRESFSSATFKADDALIVQGDSLALMGRIPDRSIALILTDPPYHTTKKKNIVGDTCFKTDQDYLGWMEQFAIEWRRILKPNGSVYCFCSSTMSARLQVMFSRYFNILSEIVWTKPNAPGYDGWKQKMKKEALRQWYPQSERIIFMETASDGNLFRSSFGASLTQWRKQAGLNMHDLTEKIGAYGKVNHGGAVANWEAGRNIPSREQFEKLRKILRGAGVSSIPNYEDIIRPFTVRKNVEFTDVWTFANVRQYKGKHPAEKPLDLLRHAILSASYEGDIVLDCFAGSGTTGEAALQTNRRILLMEIDAYWCSVARSRLRNRNLPMTT